jgi:DNA-binding NarL/FixJ family response regulator
VVDDYKPWQNFICSTIETVPGMRVVGWASDGLEAVQKARDLQPDLILLDIGLPTMNGIEVAHAIRQLSPKSKILFLSENRYREVVEEALRTGALGFVVKSYAARELLPAVEAVLQGKQFVSAMFSGSDFTEPTDVRRHNEPARNNIGAFTPQSDPDAPRLHEVGFYSDDLQLLEHMTQFVGAALKVGNAAIVCATESHRDSLLPRLQTFGVDIGAAIEQGRYLAINAVDALATFMCDRMPDPVRFMKVFDLLILTAADAARAKHPRVAIFGECVHILWAQGNPEAAIQIEKLGNQLIKTYDVDILCGYRPLSVAGGMDGRIFQRIREEHSTMHSF